MAAWGYRLGLHKGDYAEVRRAQAIAQGLTDERAIIEYVWGSWNEEMHEYMRQDCRLNLALLRHMKPNQYSQDAIALEHRVQRVCDAIEECGVPFDLKAAGELQARLVEKRDVLEKQLKAQFGFWYQPTSPDPTKAIFTPKRDNKKLGYVAGQSCTKIKLVEFNPGSRDHIARKLLERGWKPSKFTDGGKPELDEETIASIVAIYPEMDGLGEYMMVEKRLSQLYSGKQAYMGAVKDDGRIHGVINPMGTITSRAAHMFPNLGQVPSAKKPYGADFRRLFMAGPAMPNGWVALGADMSGLELRGLAHYLKPLDGGKYEEFVLNGDVHWTHAIAMGLTKDPERDKHNQLHTIVREDGSKRFIYAYIYGAGDLQVGSIILECVLNAKRNAGEAGEALYRQFFGSKDSPSERNVREVGRTVRNAFRTRIEGYDKLLKLISAQVERRNRVIGLDKRIIPVRSEHSALNFMIQSAGAILCKRWLADAFEECCAKFKLGWDGDFCFVLNVHDENQVCCKREIADEIGEIIVRCARKAGETYGFRVPLDSEYVVGTSWADTH
jgi:DNA polymerase I-like protein with 3'-5' exonuclease and polymerase domains